MTICNPCRNAASAVPQIPHTHRDCKDGEKGIGVHAAGRWCACQHQPYTYAKPTFMLKPEVIVIRTGNTS